MLLFPLNLLAPPLAPRVWRGLKDMTPLAGVVQHNIQLAQLTLPQQGFFGTRWAAEVPGHWVDFHGVSMEFQWTRDPAWSTVTVCEVENHHAINGKTH